MQKVWKYEVPVEDSFNLSLPEGAEVLHLAESRDSPGAASLWALVDTEADEEVRHFRLAGTGHPLPEMKWPTERRYLGTAVCMGARLVWHVFEEVEVPF